MRNRLRILGRSDAEIEQLEKVDRIGAETIVSAPIAGTVIQRKVGLGQYINAGATDPVFNIGDLSKVWLIANVREIRRSADEGRCAGRGFRAGLSGPDLQRQT